MGILILLLFRLVISGESLILHLCEYGFRKNPEGFCFLKEITEIYGG